METDEQEKFHRIDHRFVQPKNYILISKNEYTYLKAFTAIPFCSNWLFIYWAK